jgi:hypothetical protein
VFNKMGLQLNEQIVRDDFIVRVFHKYNFAVDNLVKYTNGDFILATGTLLYDRKIGGKALNQLFNDFSEEGKFLDNAYGQFCVLVFKNKKLYLLNDYTGLYHVYCNRDKSVVTNSFLAVSKALDKRNISTQELYEYIINGAYFGDKTFIEDIELLNSKFVWQLLPEVFATPRFSHVQKLDRNSSFDDLVQDMATNMTDYFNIIKTNFGENICTALSGGVHTRLMLGLMRKVGIKPGYLYVYGDEHNTSGRDANVIQIVKSMAKGESLSVDYIDRNRLPRFSEGEYKTLLAKRYYLNDGLGHEIGLFDNGSDLHYRLERTKKGRLQLNGGGGEVFRNYWKLPDKSYNIKTFFKTRYDRMDYSIFSDKFNYYSHFTAMQDKVKTSLGTKKDRIDRIQIELLQPEFDNKYWMGSNNSINNIYSYSLTPFGEPAIQYRGSDIPLKYKDYYRFESALMKYVDPELARYPTSHGIDLYNNKFELKPKMKYMITMNTPLWLKAYIRKHFWLQKNELFKLHGNKAELPFYMTKPYLDKIFDTRNLCMSEYVYIDKINDAEVLSRVLTAELVITDKF